MTAPFSPKDMLLPYQRKWVDDSSRFKIGIFTRQGGKDFSAAAEGVEDCIQNPKTPWLIGAAGERQALESLGKWKEWAEAYKFAIADYTEDRDSAQALINSASITWQNGSRVIAVPANPNTVRGYSANVLLTEFAFIESPAEVWRAILPTITNPLRGGLKKIRIITTPNGKGDQTYKIWTKGESEAGKGSKMQWSRHLVTIHDAVAQGLPVDIEELREALDDPIGWAQEYECEFLDGSNVLLPYELIAFAESSEATEACDFEFFKTRKPKFIGVDFGRQQDPTAIWTLEPVGDLLWTREVVALQKWDTPAQEAFLVGRIEHATRVCYDYTGPGIGLGDYLVQRFGEWKPSAHLYGKIELCNFSRPFQREIYPTLRRRFEAPTKIRIPINVTIREDLHGMQQGFTADGQYFYFSPRTREGHSDRCVALALAVRAAGDGVPAGNITPFTRNTDRSNAKRNREVVA